MSSSIFHVYTRGVQCYNSGRAKATKSGAIDVIFVQHHGAAKDLISPEQPEASTISRLSTGLHYLATCHVNAD